MMHQTEPLGGHEWNEQRCQSGDDRLVHFRRRWRHQQLAAQELIAVAVVRQSVELFDRPGLGEWHGHPVIVRVRWCMRDVGVHLLPDCHRIAAGRTATFHATLGAIAESTRLCRGKGALTERFWRRSMSWPLPTISAE